MNMHTPEQALSLALDKWESAQYTSNIYRTRCKELAQRITELENIIIGIADTELDLETLCAETIIAMRNLSDEGNDDAREFLIVNHERVAEVM